MALTAAQFRRAGWAGGVSDADGRGFRINVGGIEDTHVKSASAAAPAAAASLVTLTAPSVGVYTVEGFLALTGTAETALLNVRLRQNGTALPDGGLIPTLSGLVVPFKFTRITLAGGNFDLNVLANATAGSIYTALLTATRVE